MASSRFVMSAYQGLIALLAQETLMSGRLSALMNIFNFIPIVVVTFASGYVAEYLMDAWDLLNRDASPSHAAHMSW